MTCASSSVAAPGPVGLGLGRVERRLEPGQLDLGDREDDLVLGLELVVDRRLRDADGVGDHLQRRAAHAVLGEQVERGGDDAALGRAVAAGCSRRGARLGDAHRRRG